MSDTKIGVVTHYYDKIQVAILELSADLKIGDSIKFVQDGADLYEQKVDSMQVEHNSIDSAKEGDVIGLKVENEVKEGTLVFRVE